MNHTGKKIKVRHKLLVADGVINLILGILIMMFPAGVAAFLGLPKPGTYIYTTILGAVLFGIGAALFIEYYGAAHNIRGLGVAGAMAINFCGAGALVFWLLTVSMVIPMRGSVVLWSVAVIVLAVGIAEVVYSFFVDS